MKQTASGWVILTRKLVADFHPQNDNETTGLPRIGKVLDAHMELGDNRFRGVRQLTIWDKSDSVK